MDFVFVGGVIGICFLAVFAVCMIVIQVFLSRKQKRWPGIILPIISFLLSLTLPIYPLNIAAGVSIGQVLTVGFLANIPTIVFFVIYFVCRFMKKRNNSR